MLLGSSCCWLMLRLSSPSVCTAQSKKARLVPLTFSWVNVMFLSTVLMCSVKVSTSRVLILIHAHPHIYTRGWEQFLWRMLNALLCSPLSQSIDWLQWVISLSPWHHHVSVCTNLPETGNKCLLARGPAVCGFFLHSDLAMKGILISRLPLCVKCFVLNCNGIN